MRFSSFKSGMSWKSAAFTVQNSASWAIAQAAMAMSISRPRGRLIFLYTPAARSASAGPKGMASLDGNSASCASIALTYFTHPPRNQHYAIAGRRYLTNLRNIPINSVGVLSSPHPNAIYRDVAYFCWVLAIAGGVLLIFRRMSQVCYCPWQRSQGGEFFLADLKVAHYHYQF